jgi:hypothetical protein
MTTDQTSVNVPLTQREILIIIRTFDGIKALAKLFRQAGPPYSDKLRDDEEKEVNDLLVKLSNILAESSR